MMKSDDFTYCARQARQRDYARYLCALAAPARQRDSLFVLLAFNDELGKIREIVSEPGLGEIRLAWWREVLARDGAYDAGTHPVAHALVSVVENHNLAPDNLQAMIDGRGRDLDPTPFETVEDLTAYAEATAGSLARASLDILTIEDQENRLATTEIATAWALLGILRSLPYHERAGRRLVGSRLSLSDVVACADDLLVAARGRARQTSRKAHPVLMLARLCDPYLMRLRAANGDVRKADFEFAPWDPVWRVLSGRFSRSY